MKYRFKIHKEAGGFWAECLEIPGCVTQADSKEELFVNMEDAINIALQEPEDSHCLAALPNESYKPSRSIAEVKVDPQVALGFTVRYNNRIGRNIYEYFALKRLPQPVCGSSRTIKHIHKSTNFSIMWPKL